MAFLLFGYSLFGQNLIPNSGFENFDECPSGMRQLNKATYWRAASAGTPELFHECGYTAPISPFEGEGMVGVIFHAAYSKTSVEYIQVALRDSLEKGQNYCLTYQIRLSQESPIAINKIGAYFSTRPLYSPRWEKFIKNPQALNNDVVSNQTEWKSVKTSFKAAGGERYMTLGSFTEKHFMKEEVVGDNMHNWMSYYYLDNVELYPSDAACKTIQKEALPSKAANVKWKHIVYFDKDKTSPTDMELNRLTEFVLQLPKPFLYLVRVKGHTDVDASLEYNLQLSKERAEAIKELIIQKELLNVYTSWAGETQTINANLDDEQKAMNRRVEIEIIRE